MTRIHRAAEDTNLLRPKRLDPPVLVDDEDQEDEALFDARMADLDAGSEVPLPDEIGDRVLQGDSLLTAVCAWRGMTSTQLAQHARLTREEVSRLESGQALDEHAMRRIAGALGIDPMWIA